MSTSQNIQPSFDDEISIADIIHFFKSHKKIILIFVILGGILGGLFANFSEPVYKGYALISPAKISGAFVENQKNLLAKLNLNSFFSKKTFLNCNSQSNKDKDYDISNMAHYSIQKDTELLEIQMQHTNPEVINNCLNSIANDIRASQNLIANPLIELKKNELMLAEKKLIASEEFKKKLNDNQLKQLKFDSTNSIQELLHINMLLTNDYQIKQYINEINKLKIELALEQTKPADKFLPIFIKKKSFSPKLCIAIGLFLGLCLGILISLIKQIKI